MCGRGAGDRRLLACGFSWLLGRKAYVARLGANPEAEIIVKSIIELGSSLGRQVTAEGIERVTEVQTHRTLGCQVGQAYLYSAAIPRDKFTQLLGATPSAPPRLTHSRALRPG